MQHSMYCTLYDFLCFRFTIRDKIIEKPACSATWRGDFELTVLYCKVPKTKQARERKYDDNMMLLWHDIR